MQSREPIFNIPGVVAAVALVLASAHALRELMVGDQQELWWIYALGFIPARYWEMGPQLPGWPWATVLSPLTHMLVHGDWVHLGVNTAWLLAVGTPLARRMGALRFLLFALASGLAGAVLFTAVNPWLDVPVVGASGAISGLMGGMFRLMFSVDSDLDRAILRERPELAAKLELPEFVRDRRALTACAVFIAINILLAIGVPGLNTSGGGIAWEAHVGGFLCGVLAFDWFDVPARRSGEHGPWGGRENS